MNVQTLLDGRAWVVDDFLGADAGDPLIGFAERVGYTEAPITT